MINIVILSLFMFILNIDAAVIDKDYNWFEEEAVQRNYEILANNLKQYSMTADNSFMLGTCSVLCTQFQRSNLCNRIHIGISLYALCQKSIKNADRLFHTFRAEDVEVIKSPTTRNIFHAFGRCVPVVDFLDVRNALLNFNDVRNYPVIMGCVLYYYSKETGSDRFFSSVSSDILLYPDACCTSMYDAARDHRSMRCDAMYTQPAHEPLPHYPHYSHYRAYVLRGADPKCTPAGCKYIHFAATEDKIDILEELPQILMRLNVMAQKFAHCVNVKMACIDNVRNRIFHIIKAVECLNNDAKAMLFAWAFVMERQDYKSFYKLGFFKTYWQSISYIWTSCIDDLPNYLYALSECTDIEVYAGYMRSEETLARHQVAKHNGFTDIPEENKNSYSPEWKCRTGGNGMHDCAFSHLFQFIFSSDDALGAR
ncbi:MAG: hypothetical protein OXC30_02430 [Alphaproteobacteria bacterium]|nr:hypothetical protein [Alphaproteobacteria bacterium]